MTEETNVDEPIESEDISEESLANNIASLLTGEPIEQPDEEQEETEEQPEPEKPEGEKYTVKVDGKEFEVTLDELRAGYQRQSDFTRKSQEIAAQRAQLEAENAKVAEDKEAAESARSKYEQYIQSVPMLSMMADDTIAKAVNRLKSPEMVTLAKEDPSEYLAQRAELERVIAEQSDSKNRMVAQYNEFQQQFTAQRQAVLQDTLQRANELLNKEVEGWADGSAKKAIATYALEQAELTEEEINSLYDHRYVKILNKARLYDELMSNKDAVAKKVGKAPPKVLAPGNTQAEGEDDFSTRKKKALNKHKTGSDDALADLISSML
jgi:hypothetical protein